MKTSNNHSSFPCGRNRGQIEAMANKGKRPKEQPTVLRGKSWWETDANGDKLRHLTLVKLDPRNPHLGSYLPELKELLKTCLYLGEIQEMPGHCVVVGESGRVYWGYHTENFVKLTDDEI